MPKIAETYEEITAAARGEIKAIITTAEVVQTSFASVPYIKGYTRWSSHAKGMQYTQLAS